MIGINNFKTSMERRSKSCGDETLVSSVKQEVQALMLG